MYSYIYGFSDEIKKTAKETLLNCFYIGKQDRGSTTTFERGYDHLNNFDKNSERFKNSKCFVIARIPDFFIISTVEKYFTEMVKPELNILNNPDVNGKYGSELLPNIWSFDEYMDKLDFYVFDIEWLNTSTKFDIEMQIKATKERDEKYGNQKPIKFNDLLNKGTDEVLTIFKSHQYVLVSGEFTQKINIYSQNTKGCYLENRDTYTDIVSPYIRKQTYSHIVKKFHIREMKFIGKYKRHEYYIEYSTNKIKKGLHNPIKRVFDKSTGKYISGKKLENLVVSERTISAWYGYFATSYKVYYDPSQENEKKEENFFKNHQEGNFFVDCNYTAYFLGAFKLINDKYPTITKKLRLTSLLGDYKTIIEEIGLPEENEVYLLLGILKNTVTMGLNRHYLIDYISIVQQNPDAFLSDLIELLYEEDELVFVEARKNMPMLDDLLKYQRHTERCVLDRNIPESFPNKGSLFISFFDIPWALGYRKIKEDVKNNKYNFPKWLEGKNGLIDYLKHLDEEFASKGKFPEEEFDW